MRHLLALLAFLPSTVAADVPVISQASVEIINHLYNFRVTVAHQDEGWDHYVDRWVVKSLSGQILGARLLHMPHDKNYGYITRSLTGISIPQSESLVLIQAHDTRHGWGDAAPVSIPQVRYRP